MILQQRGDYELSPELWSAWECFLSTWFQWRVVVGMAGVFYEGIDHAALLSSMQMLGVSKQKHRDVFLQVQILECEARKLRNAKQ